MNEHAVNIKYFIIWYYFSFVVSVPYPMIIDRNVWDTWE